ncbi:MAG TPA: tRNA pseudouridine(55) synthase TruB [Bdellovibrionota bacterium]|jgi:tRNA pseudouridine55 synthase
MSSLLSGVLLVDKPAGISSAEVTNRLKKKFKFQRIGHGGTLDPFATGLLVVLVGEGTKIARFLLEGEKEYEALAALGSETDSGDLTGEVVNRCEVPEISTDDWRQHAKSWTGTIRQTPPAYSAIKVKGRPLYEYARKGEEVEVPDREATIRELEIQETEKASIRFRVRCSGGTYVRALAADLAMTAGTCAHLTALRRTASSEFRVNDAATLDSLLEMSPEQLPLRKLEEALAHLPQVTCTTHVALKIRQGNLAAFEAIRGQLDRPGYFLLLEKNENRSVPVAVCNHHPMMRPDCTIERVFDPRLSLS